MPKKTENLKKKNVEYNNKVAVYSVTVNVFFTCIFKFTAQRNVQRVSYTAQQLRFGTT